MKKQNLFFYFFLIFISLAPKLLKSQIPNPYLDSTSTWYEEYGGVSGFNIYINHGKYFINGDTILLSNSYYKLFRNSIDSTISTFPVDTSVSIIFNEYLGALREDSLKRFYFVSQGQSFESLVFDFNLSIGDSLPNMVSNYGCNVPPLIASSINTFYLGSTPLKKTHFLPGVFDKPLYEGIGASGGLIWTGSLCSAFESGACLIAYTKGLDSLYIGCGLGITGIPESTKTFDVTIFPNPFEDNISIQLRNKTLNRGSFILRNCYGQILFNEDNLRSNLIQINLKSLSSGIYFLELNIDEHYITKKLLKL